MLVAPPQTTTQEDTMTTPTAQTTQNAAFPTREAADEAADVLRGVVGAALTAVTGVTLNVPTVVDVTGTTVEVQVWGGSEPAHLSRPGAAGWAPAPAVAVYGHGQGPTVLALRDYVRQHPGSSREAARAWFDAALQEINAW